MFLVLGLLGVEFVMRGVRWRSVRSVELGLGLGGLESVLVELELAESELAELVLAEAPGP